MARKQPAPSGGLAARGERRQVAPSALRPNPWNPNEMDEVTRGKVRASLERFGQVAEVLVRQVGPDNPPGCGQRPVAGLEIIDGEHRWHQLRAAGAATAEVRNLGPVPDPEAKQLTVILNELNGAPSPARLGALLKELEAAGALPAAAEVLPYSESEVDRLMSLLTPEHTIDALAAELDAHLAASTPEIERRPDRGARFVLSAYKGWLPPHVAEAFDVTWEALGRRTGSRSPVVRARALARVLAAAREARS